MPIIMRGVAALAQNYYQKYMHVAIASSHLESPPVGDETGRSVLCVIN